MVVVVEQQRDDDTNQQMRHYIFIRSLSYSQDVVYSDVKFKPFRDVTPSSTNGRTDTMYADVTYAKVFVGQQPT